MPASGPWMPEPKLRRLFRAGKTVDEIAAINERNTRIDDVPGTGLDPTRPGVAKKFARLGFPRRNLSHEDLIPWQDIRPEHATSRLRKMLEAESRRRQLIAADERLLKGEELEEAEKALVERGLSETDKTLTRL